MKAVNRNFVKRVYQTPVIEMIMLDNEISLVLTTEPPVGPGEIGSNITAPEFFNKDPFGNNA